LCLTAVISALLSSSSSRRSFSSVSCPSMSSNLPRAFCRSSTVFSRDSDSLQENRLRSEVYIGKVFWIFLRRLKEQLLCSCAGRDTQQFNVHTFCKSSYSCCFSCTNSVFSFSSDCLSSFSFCKSSFNFANYTECNVERQC
jgi:hypothetical protein